MGSCITHYARPWASTDTGNDEISLTLMEWQLSDLGVSMECTISMGRSVHFHATPTLWSGIGVALVKVENMQIDTPKIPRSGIGVFWEWHWNGSNRVAMECALRSGVGVYVGSGVGVAMECATDVELECVANMQINTAMPLQGGSGLVRVEWQWSVHFIVTPANLWKWHWSGDMWW